MLHSQPSGEDIIEGGVRKRPFCNGFTGCGRTGKRTSSAILNALRLSESVHDASSQISSPRSKRPFCNGFFGCGNPRKRIIIRHTYHQPGSMVQEADKRALCTSYGCRNMEQALPLPWLRSMKTMFNEQA